MTETLQAPPQATPDSGISPNHIVLNLGVTLLAPMFLIASGGDIELARQAAASTITAYGARNHADLIAISQIIGCSLTALASMSLSMQDTLSLSMMLRLRTNANAMMRNGERTTRSRKDFVPSTVPAETVAEDPRFQEANILAEVAATRQRLARTQPPAPPAEPEPPPVPERTPAQPPNAELDRRWAAAMADVAGEFAAAIPDLPPLERKAATIRAAALNTAANALLTGDIPPDVIPFNLAEMMRPNPA
jgi:alkylhydroperoxidase family enzyme